MNRRNRNLARAKWDLSVGNWGKYARFGPKDWRVAKKDFQPMSQCASTSIVQHIHCDHDWKRQHRTRRWEKGERHQICIKCRWTRLHPRYRWPISLPENIPDTP